MAIARTLIKETPIIIADEPTGNLDSKSSESVLKLLYEISKDKLVIVVSHNYEQIEKYTTRKIVMNDGKIIEDKKIDRAEIKENKNTKIESESFSLSNINGVQNKKKSIININKIRLGIRNAFNIKIKFILLLTIFLFLAISTFAEYVTYLNYKEIQASNGWSLGFQDKSDKRIVLRKEDGTSIEENEIKSIENITNVDYVYTNEPMLDTLLTLHGENKDTLTGIVKSVDELEGSVDVGRMPESENEIVLVGNIDNYQLKNYQRVLNNEFALKHYNISVDIEPLEVVGIKYDDTIEYYINMHVGQEAFDTICWVGNANSSITSFVFNEKNYITSFDEYTFVPSDKVEKGEAIVPYEMHHLTKYDNAYNYPINITVKNMYYTYNLDLNIKEVYSKYTMEKVLGLNYKDEYDKNSVLYDGLFYIQKDYLQTIYINEEEYYEMYNQGNFQVSAFVKDFEIVRETIEELENLGYKALYVKDTVVNYSAEYDFIEATFLKIVLVILSVIIFFISYFIIRIILKSRNVYYATIRILGLARKNAKELLQIELLTVMNIAYGAILIFIGLVKNDVIVQDVLKGYLKYIKVSDLIIVYALLMIMSLLISNRYSKKLFKESALKTHREEEV